MAVKQLAEAEGSQIIPCPTKQFSKYFCPLYLRNFNTAILYTRSEKQAQEKLLIASSKLSSFAV